MVAMLELPTIPISERSPAELIAQASPYKKRQFYKSLTEEEAEQLLYEWQGFWARPKQRIPESLGKEHMIWMILAGRGFGKALALDTPLPTPTGWTTMGDVQVGDRLIDERGMACKVTFVTPIQYNRSCYRVKFSDGTEVIADADHMWETIDKRTRKALGRAKNPRLKPKVVTTQEIANSLYHPSGEVNHAIANTRPLKLPHQSLTISPYVLGAWLGDGSSKSAEITTIDTEILDEIQNAGYEITPRNSSDITYTIGGSGTVRDEVTGRFTKNPHSLCRQLIDLGVMGNKHIPQAYLRGSYNQRLELLQGLMDTDGFIEPGGNCEFTSTNESLARGVYELLMTFGIKATIGEARAKLYGKDCGKKYRVHFTPYIPVFKLSRKAERIRVPGKQHKRQLRRYIVECERVESVPVKCVQVDSPSHLFLCSESFIPTHNTRTGAETVKYLVEECGYRHIALIGRTAADVRDVMVEGPSGLLSVYPPDQIPTYEPAKRRITFKNGAVATTFSADKPDQLRGPQHDLIWGDELAAWRYEEAWDQAMFGLRLGDAPIALVTTTPRPTKLIKELAKDETVYMTIGTTYENAGNLAAPALKRLMDKYHGTTLGQQELEAKILSDTPGALWTRAILDEFRTRQSEVPDLVRVVVGIDPAATSNESSSETGIIAAGIDRFKHIYVLDDYSLRGRPSEWANKAIDLYEIHDADRIVAEVNQGGDMVETTIRTHASNVSIKQVRATRGKFTRAEPVSALYEQGRVSHVGTFSELEDQMCTWLPSDAKSPDRIDALVWAITELTLKNLGRPTAGSANVKNIYPSQQRKRDGWERNRRRSRR